MTTISDRTPMSAGPGSGFFLGGAIAMTLVIVAGFSIQLAMGRSSFSAPPLVHAHAVVFMGADSTTGYGKSTIARFLACKFAVHMTAVLGRPKTEATVLASTTLDDLSGVACKSGWAVMFDELAVGDKEQVQYMSTGIMKILADPQSTSGARARGKNVVLAGDTARIFTTNATSLEDWAAGRFVVTLPIKRKMWVFVIKHKMIEDDWAKRNDYVGSELF